MEAGYFYRNYFNIKEPYSYQIEVWNKSKEYLSKGVPLLIKAPTGAGKTEAVLKLSSVKVVDYKYFISVTT